MIKVINTIFLILAIIISLMALIKDFKKKNGREEKEKIKDRIYNILLICILVIAVFIRLWKFGIIPGGFNQDGAMAAVDGLALAKYGTDRFGTFMPAHLYAWGYGQMSSLLSYLMALFIKIFGLTPLVARMPQLLVSIMGGIFFYLFMKDNFGKKVGLSAAIFVAINPWHFMQSRWTLDCNLLPHFFMGGLYFLSKGLKDNKKWLYVSMIFFGLCMYCYGIALYVIPFFLILTAIYYYINKQITIKEILISVFIYLLIAWPFILTMMVNYFKWNTIKLPFITMQYFSDSVRSKDILFFSHNIGRQFIINLQYLLNTTILQKKDLPWNDILGFGTMYYFTMPFAILGLISLFKSYKKENRLLVIMVILTGIWTGLTTNYVNVNRMNIIYYGIMMLAVIGIYQIIIKLKNTTMMVFAMYMISFILFVGTYFTSYAKEIDREFYAGFGDALINAEATGKDKIYITADLQSFGNYKVSEILTMFYDKMDAKYFQGKTNINNGKEYLSYNERYHYQSITPEVVDSTIHDDVVYIIMNCDKIYFNDQYEIIDYGNYSTVVKK